MPTNEAIIARECRSCSFYVGSKLSGVCHRNPPVPMLLPAQEPISGRQVLEMKGCWGPVGAKDWCGEYQRNLSVALGNAQGTAGAAA